MNGWLVMATTLALCACSTVPARTQNHDWRDKLRSLDEIKRPAPRPLVERFLNPGCTLYEHPDGAGTGWRFRTNEFIATTGYRLDMGRFSRNRHLLAVEI